MELSHHEVDGIKYTLQQGRWGLVLSIWHTLVCQYIFESGSCKSREQAEETVKHLWNEGFIKLSK